MGWYDAGRVRCAGARVGEDGQAAQARRSLRRAGLPADAGAVRIPEGPRVPGVRVLRRRPRLHARVRGEDLGHPQGARDRLRRRVHVRRREDRPLRGGARRPGPGAGQARAHLRPNRPTARLRRRQRRRRHRDADLRQVRSARQSRRRGARVRLHQGRREVPGHGRAAGLDGREHENDWTTVFKNDGAA
jgi:hypothetical protein